MAEARATTGSVLHPETEGILEAAADFLWSDEMAESLDTFSKNHAHLFAGAAFPPTEHKLEWTQAHIDFQELFEFRLETFVATQPFSSGQFLAACQDALEHGNAGTTVSASIVEMVLMTGTYNFFVQMMIAAAVEAAEMGTEMQEM